MGNNAPIMKEPTMAARTTKSVVITVVAGEVTDIKFNATKALDTFRTVKGLGSSWELGTAGQRYTLGLAYWLGTKADREALVVHYGKGVIRRGLLVTSRATSDEAIATKVADLAESLRTRTAA
jgi:hypothetical protein